MAELVSPVAPDEQELEFLKAVTVVEHKAPEDAQQSAEAPQLSLKVNDIVYVLEQDASGWWGGHKEGQPEIRGWFPGNCVRVLCDEGASVLEQWGGVLPEELPEEMEYDTAVSEEGLPASRMKTVPYNSTSRGGAVRLSTPTFPGAADEGNSRVAAVAVAAGGRTGGTAKAEVSYEGTSAMSTAEMVRDGEELRKAKAEIEKLKAENANLRRSVASSDVAIARLQSRHQEAIDEVRNTREELARELRKHQDKSHEEAKSLKEELLREKSHSEATASELRQYFQQQLQQKDVELSRRIADISARHDSEVRTLRDELQTFAQAPRGSNEPRDQRNPSRSAARASIVEVVDSNLQLSAEDPSIAVDDLKRRLFSSTVSEYPPNVAAALRSSSPAEAGHARGLSTSLTTEIMMPPEVSSSTSGLRSAPAVPSVATAVDRTERSNNTASSRAVTPTKYELSEQELSKHLDRDETPPRGLVRAKVSQFEQRCTTPQRDPLRRGGEPVPTPLGHPSRNNRRGQSPVQASSTSRSRGEAPAADLPHNTPPMMPKNTSQGRAGGSPPPQRWGSPSRMDVAAAEMKVCAAAASVAGVAPPKVQGRQPAATDDGPEDDHNVPLLGMEPISRSCKSLDRGQTAAHVVIPSASTAATAAPETPASIQFQPSMEPMASMEPTASMDCSSIFATPSLETSMALPNPELQSPRAGRELSVKERIRQMKLK